LRQIRREVLLAATYALIIALLFAATGCQDLTSAHAAFIGVGTPAVEAIGGGSATLTLTACPPPPLTDEQLQHLLHILNTSGVIVLGRDGATARLDIDLCPQQE
jgi:hypothetical protein